MASAETINVGFMTEGRERISQQSLIDRVVTWPDQLGLALGRSPDLTRRRVLEDLSHLDAAFALRLATLRNLAMVASQSGDRLARQVARTNLTTFEVAYANSREKLLVISNAPDSYLRDHGLLEY